MVDFSKLASNNPENMVQGGLADDFDGVVVKARYCPWNYQGKLDHYTLAVRLDIRADGEAETFDVYYSAGDLEQFMPSNDGENPVNTDGFGTPGFDMAQVDGIYAIRVGKKEGLSNNSNWAQFMGGALEARLPKERLSPDIRFMEGVYGHWNRIAQKKRAGLVKATAPGTDPSKDRQKEILALTEFKAIQDPNTKNAAKASPFAAPAAPGIPGVASTPPAFVSSGPAPTTLGGFPTASPATTAPATASTAPATVGASGDLDSKLVAIVSEALRSAPEGLSKSKLPPLALQKLNGAEKGKGVSRIVNAEFLAAQTAVWAFDAESGMLYAL